MFYNTYLYLPSLNDSIRFVSDNLNKSSTLILIPKHKVKGGLIKTPFHFFVVNIFIF